MPFPLNPSKSNLINFIFSFCKKIFFSSSVLVPMNVILLLFFNASFEKLSAGKICPPVFAAQIIIFFIYKIYFRYLS